MKKIVTLTGHKHTKKDIIAQRLAKNSDVKFVRPFTERGVKNCSDDDLVDYNVVLPSALDEMIDSEDVLTITKRGKYRYVFFKFQLTSTYNVLIVDDYQLKDIKDVWDDEIYTVKLTSKKEVESDYVGEYYFNDEFDEVFDVDVGDIDELEWRIE